MAAKIPPGLNQEVAKIALEGGNHWGASDQARYDKLMAERGGSDANKPASVAVDMFDFQKVMDDYYSSDPKDDAGIAQKRTFQQNMIQSGFDQQLSMAQAERAQEYDLDARRVTSELELANQKALMKDTYTYGMSKMGAEYQMQSRFAVDEQKRLLDQMSAAGNIQQEQTRTEGTEKRKIQAQDQAGDLGTGDYVDLGRIGASGVEERASIAAQNEANIKQIDALAAADVKRNKETVQADVDRASGTQQGVVGGTQMERDRQTGDIAKEQILTQGDVDVNKIGATGDEERKTMQEQNRLTAKDRANQRTFSRELAAR